MTEDHELKLDGHVISVFHNDLAIQACRGAGIGFMFCGLVTETITLFVIYKDLMIANRLYLCEANNSLLHIIGIFMTTICILVQNPLLEVLYLAHLCPLVLSVIGHVYINRFAGNCTILMEKTIFYCTISCAVLLAVVTPLVVNNYSYKIALILNTYSILAIIVIIGIWIFWTFYYYVSQPQNVTPANFHLLNVPLFVAASWLSFVCNLIYLHVDYRSFVTLIFVNPLVRFSWHMYAVPSFKDSVMNLCRMNRSRVQINTPEVAAAWSAGAGVQLVVNYPQPQNPDE